MSHLMSLSGVKRTWASAERFFVIAGGLASYGAHTIDQYRRGAGYVDRILKGEKPAELPVQAPTKYKMVINQTLLGRARRLPIEYQ